jgi:hypothetical protein
MCLKIFSVYARRAIAAYTLAHFFPASSGYSKPCCQAVQRLTAREPLPAYPKWLHRSMVTVGYQCLPSGEVNVSIGILRATPEPYAETTYVRIQPQLGVMR